MPGTPAATAPTLPPRPTPRCGNRTSPRHPAPTSVRKWPRRRRSPERSDRTGSTAPTAPTASGWPPPLSAARLPPGRPRTRRQPSGLARPRPRPVPPQRSATPHTVPPRPPLRPMPNPATTDPLTPTSPIRTSPRPTPAPRDQAVPGRRSLQHRGGARTREHQQGIDFGWQHREIHRQSPFPRVSQARGGPPGCPTTASANRADGRGGDHEGRFGELPARRVGAHLRFAATGTALRPANRLRPSPSVARCGQ